MRFPSLIACLSFTLFLVGCGTTPERRLDAPAVQISALDAGALSLRIVNPNTAPLVVNRSTHTLYLADERIGRIDDRKSVGIPPLGSVVHTVALPAAIGDKVRERLASSSGQIRASVDSSFDLIVGADGSLTLKAVGGGLVQAAQ